MTTFEEKQKQLFEALMNNRANQDVMSAITAHVEGKTGLKLSEYMKNGASEADKIAMIEEVLMIANGEQPKATETATTPAPEPPAKRIDPFAMADAGPQPGGDPRPLPLPPKEPVVARQYGNALSEAMIELHAHLGQLTNKIAKVAQSQSAAPAASEEQIRRICREEIRAVLADLAKAMQQ